MSIINSLDLLFKASKLSFSSICSIKDHERKRIGFIIRRSLVRILILEG